MNEASHRTWRSTMTEILVPLGFLAVWLLLQLWILPRMGVQT